MAWSCEKTHRCDGSLAAEVGIRKNAHRYKYISTYEVYEGWSLWRVDYDIDYNCYYDHHVATITFCPFCGERLEV